MQRVVIRDVAQSFSASDTSGTESCRRVRHNWSVSAPVLPDDAVTQVVAENPSEEDMLHRKLQILSTFSSLATEASLGLRVPSLASGSHTGGVGVSVFLSGRFSSAIDSL